MKAHQPLTYSDGLQSSLREKKKKEWRAVDILTDKWAIEKT